MNLTKSKIITAIIIFVLSFLIHFGYDVFPNSISALFFPVNESIWEHMKMLYTSIILGGLFDFLIMKKFKIDFNNFFLSLYISATTSIPIFLIVYLPFYYKIGSKMILNIIVLIITIIISQVINYFIQKRNNIDILNTVSIALIIINYVILGYLTYHPIRNEIFFDHMDEKYGINTYRLTSQEPNH